MNRYWIAALTLLTFSQVFERSAAAYSAVVQVAGWTTTGVRLEKIWAVLEPIGGGKEYRGSGKLVELSVPTGEYLLQVSAPGFLPRWQVFRVSQPTVFRSVALPIAPPHGSASSSLTGAVHNYDGDPRGLRVRLMGLYGSEVWESVLDALGSFSFPADEGIYLLVVFASVDGGTVVLDSRPLAIRLGQRQTVLVDLKGKQGELIPRSPL
jgi:hypothetical protein